MASKQTKNTAPIHHGKIRETLYILTAPYLHLHTSAVFYIFDSCLFTLWQPFIYILQLFVFVLTAVCLLMEIYLFTCLKVVCLHFWHLFVYIMTAVCLHVSKTFVFIFDGCLFTFWHHLTVILGTLDKDAKKWNFEIFSENISSNGKRSILRSLDVNKVLRNFSTFSFW